MLIDELKDKYKDKKFIKVKEFVSFEIAEIDTIEELLDLDDYFLYTEDFNYDSDNYLEAMDSGADKAKDILKTKIRNKEKLEDLDSDIFYLERDNEQYISNKLIKEDQNNVVVSIRSLKYNVGFTESSNNYIDAVDNISQFLVDIYLNNERILSDDSFNVYNFIQNHHFSEYLLTNNKKDFVDKMYDAYLDYIVRDDKKELDYDQIIKDLERNK